MENVVLVNDQDEQIGTADKSTVHSHDTPLHRGFSVFLFNQQGELLIQKRAKGKTFAGFWSNSCCGHPREKESYEDAAKRRLHEELGINDVVLKTILPNFRYEAEHEEVRENEICPVMVAFFADNPVPDQGEVEEIKWISWIDFLGELDSNQGAYSTWSKEEAELLEENPTFHQLLSDLRGN